MSIVKSCLEWISEQAVTIQEGCIHAVTDHNINGCIKCDCKITVSFS